MKYWWRFLISLVLLAVMFWSVGLWGVKAAPSVPASWYWSQPGRLSGWDYTTNQPVYRLEQVFYSAKWACDPLADEKTCDKGQVLADEKVIWSPSPDQPGHVQTVNLQHEFVLADGSRLLGVLMEVTSPNSALPEYTYIITLVVRGQEFLGYYRSS